MTAVQEQCSLALNFVILPLSTRRKLLDIMELSANEQSKTIHNNLEIIQAIDILLAINDRAV